MEENDLNYNNGNSENEANELVPRKTDEEIANLLNLDEYFFERFHYKKKLNKEKCTHVAMKIYQFIKYYCSNPLSLKELARIQERKDLLNTDYKMKCKIENDLNLPTRLKDYLLFKEFN